MPTKPTPSLKGEIQRVETAGLNTHDGKCQRPRAFCNTNCVSQQSFYSLPVQPILFTGFMPTPVAQQQFGFALRRADTTAPRPRKRVHVCPVASCGKRFTTSGNLSRHKRMHGKIDPLKCPVSGCICVFPSANKLERHLTFHYGGDVKVCHVEACGRTFSTTGNLNRHLKKHHGGVASPPPASPAAAARSPSTTAAKCEGGIKEESSVCSSPCSSPCSTASDSGSDDDNDNDASIEPWWSSPSEPGSSAAKFDCVWNDDLLDALSVMLDDAIDAEAARQFI